MSRENIEVIRAFMRRPTPATGIPYVRRWVTQPAMRDRRQGWRRACSPLTWSR